MTFLHSLLLFLLFFHLNLTKGVGGARDYLGFDHVKLCIHALPQARGKRKNVYSSVLTEANSHGRQEGEVTIISCFVAQINLLWITLSFGLFDKISFFLILDIFMIYNYLSIIFGLIFLHKFLEVQLRFWQENTLNINCKSIFPKISNVQDLRVPHKVWLSEKN